MLYTPTKHLLRAAIKQSTRFLHSQTNKSIFKLDELVLTSVATPQHKSTKPQLKEKLIRLSANGILRSKTFEIFHENIIGAPTNPGIFRIFPESEEPNKYIQIKRPTLYEYIIGNNNKRAVSSHFSVLSYVPFLLELQRDSKVLESGTGNASMTLFLSQYLGKNADLHTYDIKPTEMVERAYADWRNNFELTHDFEERWFDNVNFYQGDIGEQSFDKSLEGYFDCFYFDLANTEKAIVNCYRFLKRNGVIVLNTMHLTQIMKMLRVAKNLKLDTEVILEPTNRYWRVAPFDHESDDVLNFVCRVEDNSENITSLGYYWPGFLVKLRKKE